MYICLSLSLNQPQLSPVEREAYAKLFDKWVRPINNQWVNINFHLLFIRIKSNLTN